MVLIVWHLSSGGLSRSITCFDKLSKEPNFKDVLAPCLRSHPLAVRDPTHADFQRIPCVPEGICQLIQTGGDVLGNFEVLATSANNVAVETSRDALLQAIEEEEGNLAVGPVIPWREFTQGQPQLSAFIQQYIFSKSRTPSMLRWNRVSDGIREVFDWLILNITGPAVPPLTPEQALSQWLTSKLSAMGDHFVTFTDTGLVDRRLKTAPNVVVPAVAPQQQHLQPLNEVKAAVPPDVFQAVGQAILDTMEVNIRETVGEITNVYTSLRVMLLVPPRRSLYQQTVERLRATFTPAQLVLMGAAQGKPEELVLTAHPTKGAEYANMLQEASSDPSTMYMVIQDECHWGMLMGSSLTTHFLHTTLSNAPNLYLLQVSATPYNILAVLKSDALRRQIISWDDVGNKTAQLQAINSAYTGLAQLLQSNRIHDGSLRAQADLRQSFFVLADVEQRMLSDAALITEYMACVLAQLGGISAVQGQAVQQRYPSTWTIVQSLLAPGPNGKGNLVVVRLATTCLAVLLQKWMRQVLRLLRPDAFDVVADVGSEDEQLWDKLSNESRRRWATWVGHPKAANEPFSYPDLKYLPMLLLVVEKGRFGDTFPSNFVHFDLRARYNGDAYYASIIQDVGRAFGYGQRPQVWVPRYLKAMLLSNTATPHQALDRLPNAAPENPPVAVDPSDPYVDLLDFWAMNALHPENPMHGLPALNNRQRFLLYANPQNGKTGAFMHTLILLIQQVHGANIPAAAQYRRQQSAFNQQLYALRGQGALTLHAAIQTANGLATWQAFHVAANQNYQLWRQRTWPIPWEAAYLLLKSMINSSVVQHNPDVVDMGCGSASLAQSLERDAFPARITNIDHHRVDGIPAHIQVLEANMAYTGLANTSQDVIVFACALWGTQADLQAYLAEAHRLLRPGGVIIIVDAINNRVSGGPQRDLLLPFLLSVMSSSGFNADEWAPHKRDQLFGLVAKKAAAQQLALNF